MPSDKNVVLYIHKFSRYGTEHFVAHPMYAMDHATELQPNGHPRVTLRHVDSYEHLELEHLSIQTYGWDTSLSGGRRMLGGLETVYVDVNEINLRRAQTMAATLSKIEKALDKATEKDGYPAHIGQYMLRVARALGIKAAVVRMDSERHARSFDEMKLRLISLVEASGTMEGWTKHFMETGEPSIAIVA